MPRAPLVWILALVALGGAALGWVYRDRLRVLGAGVAMVEPRAPDNSPADSLAALRARQDTVATDSLFGGRPFPPALLGVWHHGSSRAKYADSLTLHLRTAGAATMRYRRYSLDNTGWHLVRTNRDGAWLTRYDGSGQPELCARWTKPDTPQSCEDVVLFPDSGDGDLVLQFGGRYWRRGPTSDTARARGAD